MTITALLIAAVLIVLLVYVAQQLPAPWPIICYVIAAIVLIVALIRVLGVDVAVAKGRCEGTAPYWAVNHVSPPPPFFGALLAPGVLAITVMSVNAKLRYIETKPSPHQMREGGEVETTPGCLLAFMALRARYPQIEPQ